MAEALCTFCHDPVDPSSRFVWRRVIGWERKAPGEGRRGGSDIALRERCSEFACNACISLHRRGLAGQESLL